MDILVFFIVVIVAYALGSIPFGLLLTRLAGLGDIRQVGSGNIGATNVLRTGKKGLAVLTLLLDGGKGAVAVLLTSALHPLSETVVLAAGMASLLGHLFPVWLGFKGGKGVATFVGITTALAWPLGLAVMGTWIFVAAVFRYSSLAALVALGLSPVYALVFNHNAGHLAALLALMAALVFWKHAVNIKRLLNGTESKIGFKGSSHDSTHPQ